MTMKTARFLFALSILLLATAQARAQDRAAAEAAFREGRALMKEGKYDDACEKLSLSQQLDPAVGTLTNLGLCHEHQGKLASAWAELNGAADMAAQGGQGRRAEKLRAHAASLEGRLSRLVVRVKDGGPPGLKVTLAGKEVTKMVDTSLPVDRGNYRIEATADGFEPWSQNVDIVDEGRTTSVEVPVLQKNQAVDPEPVAVESDVDGEPHEETEREPMRRGYSLGIRLGLGTSSASDDNVTADLSSTSSMSFDVRVALPLSQYLSFVTGAGYSPQGVGYPLQVDNVRLDIEESLKYLQLPALLRAELALPIQGAILRPIAEAGLGFDAALGKGGSYDSAEVGGGSLDSIGYYDEHKSVNVSALLAAGLEVGFGERPSWFVGLDVAHDRHLLNEWSDEFFTNQENYKYRATRLGFRVSYQPPSR